MKKIITFLTVAIIMIAFSVNLTAQVTQPANATARIITPISLTKVTDLAFGTIISGTALSTIQVTTAGARTVTAGDATLSPTVPGAACSFTVAGEANAGYSITLSATPFNISFGAITMPVTSLTTNPVTPGNLGVAGSQTLLIGGTLDVAAGQAVGSYTGTFNVTVAYN